MVTKLLRLVSFDAKPTAVPVPFSCSLPAEALSINSVRELAGILLCLLLNQRWRPKRSSPNAYRQALSRLQDQPGVLSFEDLWRYLQSEILHRREPALLLYALLAENASFESFVMARSDIDSLVWIDAFIMPIVKQKQQQQQNKRYYRCCKGSTAKF